MPATAPLRGSVTNLALKKIRIDGGTQPRLAVSDEVVAQYRDDMAAGAVFPPVVVFYDGKDYWLADGFHRFHAANGAEQLAAEVKQGTQRDAVLFSVGANASHGLRRTNHDKRRAVERLLLDSEWSKWSDRAIAKACGVGADMVGDLRRLSVGNRQIEQRVSKVERNGTVYEMALPVRDDPAARAIDRAHELIQREKETFARLEAQLPATAKVKVEVPESRVITLTNWNRMTEATQAKVIADAPVAGGFNRQDNGSIEWAQWSWNPVTGCLHGCAYCYARDIAERFYEQKFAPSLIAARLKTPRTMKPPAGAATNVGLKNVFTCSMADLFGKWVPKEWIDAVLAEVRAAPQWNFLFLTKFPGRLAQFEFPDNAWVGTSVDRQSRVKAAESAFAKVNAKVKWLSVEPLLEPLTFSQLDIFQWLVIGGASSSNKTPPWEVPWTWVRDLEAQAEKAGVGVYRKPNLGNVRREYPGAKIEIPKAAPDSLWETA